jgi:hypothetical protein
MAVMSVENRKGGLDWIGLDWIGLDWIGLDWIGLSPSTADRTFSSQDSWEGCEILSLTYSPRSWNASRVPSSRH